MSNIYNDPDFMESREARPLRILAEYIEPQTRLQQMDIHRGLIFWGSARLHPRPEDQAGPESYYDKARQLARRMMQWTMDKHEAGQRYYICTGGGPGIMEAANRGAWDVNPELSLGLNIELPHEQGVNAWVHEKLNFEFHYFFMRKFWFVNLARALVVFPGGFGTMDELFEMLTLTQTGRHAGVPVVLYGRDFWQRLINFDVFSELGLIDPEDRDIFRIVDSLDEAYDFLVDCLPRYEPFQEN